MPTDMFKQRVLVSYFGYKVLKPRAVGIGLSARPATTSSQDVLLLHTQAEQEDIGWYFYFKVGRHTSLELDLRVKAHQ